MIQTGLQQRLQFLARVVRREMRHLEVTDARLFLLPFTPERARELDDDPDLAERVDAFVSRFGRLQDTLADKLIPTMLSALGEKPAAMLDNLDKAERLGWLDSAETWMTMRNLRNQMVHEYLEDPLVLASAVQTGHEFVPTLLKVAQTLLAEMKARGWSA